MKSVLESIFASLPSSLGILRQIGYCWSQQNLYLRNKMRTLCTLLLRFGLYNIWLLYFTFSPIPNFSAIPFSYQIMYHFSLQLQPYAFWKAVPKNMDFQSKKKIVLIFIFPMSFMHMALWILFRIEHYVKYIY